MKAHIHVCASSQRRVLWVTQRLGKPVAHIAQLKGALWDSAHQTGDWVTRPAGGTRTEHARGSLQKNMYVGSTTEISVQLFTGPGDWDRVFKCSEKHPRLVN